MEKIKFKVEYKDLEYSRALEKAILLKSGAFVLSNDTPDVLINEISYPPYQPVQSIIAKIMANLNCQTGPAKPLKNVKFTAFTAAIGGSGLSTTALCYARIVSRILNKKVSFITFDPWFRNLFPKEDEYGVTYLSEIPETTNIDELVLDIPYGIENYRDYLDMCERQVFVLGFQEKRIEIGEKYEAELSNAYQNYINPPFTIAFRNHFQDVLDINDIHSELGKEVLELARKLESE